MEDIINNNEILSKKALYLLYTQALEIHTLYYQEFGDKIVNESIEKYFLINKNWLDEYKSKNDYFQIIQDVEDNPIDNYSKINDSLKKNGEIDIIDVTKVEQELLPDYELIIPKNFVIVKKEIFESLSLDSNLLYDVIIGEKNIFIFDKKKENSKYENIFVCSIQYNEYSDDISDFNINIDYILMFIKDCASEGKENFFELIKNGRGIKNYFRIKRLDNKHYGEQNIIDEKKRIRGVLFKVKNDKNLKKEKKISEEFFNQYLKKVYPDDYNEKITEFVIDSMNKNEINRFQSIKNSKCITIYGDLYYYLNNQDNENNCNITEFDNINQNY